MRESCYKTTLHVHRSTSLHLGSRRLALLPRSNIPGDYRCLAIPVPIPNTVVKQPPPMIVLLRESRLSPGSLSALHLGGARFFFASAVVGGAARLVLQGGRPRGGDLGPVRSRFVGVTSVAGCWFGVQRRGPATFQREGRVMMEDAIRGSCDESPYGHG